jgi:hypothetical protein
MITMIIYLPVYRLGNSESILKWPMCHLGVFSLSSVTQEIAPATKSATQPQPLALYFSIRQTHHYQQC